MRTLLLLRHGKSDWDHDLPDHQRPLSKRGRKAVKAMGKYSAKTGPQPHRALCADARRTIETWEILSDAGWGAEAPHCELLPELYLADAKGLLRRIQQMEAKTTTLLVIAHEPGCSGLVQLLTGARLRYPTAALAQIDMPHESWRALDENEGELRLLLPPKQLPSHKTDQV
ncbi:MAG: histidine phosphatase family protein [Planctomycetes bacterium]|nr:histidine phosphatase family protein [Planctomycetota bacterium]